MKQLTALLALAILAGALILSYVHTLQLMGMAGLPDLLGHVGVVTFEMAFALGTLALVFGTADKMAALVSLAIGLSVVTAGNVSAGVAYGIAGVAIGVAIPAAVVAAEFLLKSALSHGRAVGRGTTTTRTAVVHERTTQVAPEAPQSAPESDGQAKAALAGTPARPIASESVSATAIDASTSATSGSRQQRVALLRQKGVPVPDIASEVGVSVRTVHRDLSAIG